MKFRLNTLLSAAFVILVLLTAAIISLSANFLIRDKFSNYVSEQQKNFANEIAENLASQYNAETGTWNHEYIHGFGMFALNDGYIIKLTDNSGNVVWDGEHHDMHLCHDIMKKITDRMNSRKENDHGSFETSVYPLVSHGINAGSVAISYYTPYYYNDNEFDYINSISYILFATCIISLFIAIIMGMLLSRRMVRPLTETTKVAKMISEGNYAVSANAHSHTLELSDLSDSVSQMAHALERKEVLRKQLTSDVAHELRTPLTNIATHLEMMIEGIWTPSDMRLQNCYDEISHISSIVSDLERLQSIENESLELKKKEVDLEELVNSITTGFEREFGQKQIECVIHTEPCTISIDAERMRQVLVNLISNAIKYTECGGQVEITLSNFANSAVISIKDNGIGISSEDQPMIFERFFRADRSRNRATGGAGIGLAIAKAIVDSHNGTLCVSSELGKGSTFTVTIPKNHL